ncbi:MAG: betaine/proline/choline family ABC transporter ATP-binding protein [Actinobacteria bacterium]|nr:betaine/proline/choline family ABC transporter ATP-binding protein [Actinomycetota bacterium]
MTDALIHLENVSKTYPGTSVPAVAELDLRIPKGDVLVLVGPSGCGKSTTLRLINRMIEPTGGRIIFDGEDVTEVNADNLRRRMGYVIQQIGLFPHRTIAENISTVPNLLGWKSDRISSRIDELLDMVGMDPSIYRNRYPKELSGGQAQRVGVARALSADPEVMLMDEPFGAIDPITRDRLQNEFLRLQEELQKTIVFVTHDIDEAIKMGDRIAILRQQSQIAQYDTPEAILAQPANDFVSDFLGKGAIIKGLNLKRMSDIEPDRIPAVRQDASPDEARRALDESSDGRILVLDEQDRPLRWIDRSAVEGDQPLANSGYEVTAVVEPDDTLRDSLELMLQSTASSACCIDDDGRYRGVVRIEDLTRFLAAMQQAERERRAESDYEPEQVTLS